MRAGSPVLIGALCGLVGAWSCAPPVVPHPAKDKTETPTDCGALVRCGSTCVDLQRDPTSCGACDRICVIANAHAGCQKGDCVIASCKDGYYDADKDVKNGCETTSTCVADADCKTSCDSIGKTVCQSGKESCVPPVETCNAKDDNCNGACDEGGLAGCRVGVHRAVGKGHFYTTDLKAAMSPPFSLEAANYFYLYVGPSPGLSALYLCPKPGGMWFLTTDARCEVLNVDGTPLGFVSTDARCGATPLYRMYSPASGDHFYTTSAAERDAAVSMYGYQSEGGVGYVFPAP